MNFQINILVGSDVPIYRQIVAQIVRLSDNQIRTFGLTAMITGLVVLFVVRN